MPRSKPHDVRIANKWLQKPSVDGLRGTTQDGRPKFRVVWSEDVFEVQPGPHGIFTESGLFIKEITTPMKVPKYAGIGVENQWVMERFTPMPRDSISAHEYNDLNRGDPDMGYEPVWVFPDHVEPNKLACSIVLRSLSDAPTRITPRDYAYLEAQEQRKKKKKVMEYLEDNTPYLAGKLVSGSAVFVDSRRKFNASSK